MRDHSLRMSRSQYLVLSVSRQYFLVQHNHQQGEPTRPVNALFGICTSGAPWRSKITPMFFEAAIPTTLSKNFIPPLGQFSPGEIVLSTNQCPTGIRTVFSPYCLILSKSSSVIKVFQCSWNATFALSRPNAETQSHSDAVLPHPIDFQVLLLIHGSTMKREPRFTPRIL